MIAVDTNILVYAHREDSAFHDRAYACIAELAESGRDWAIPWPCIHEFLAVCTHPRIFNPPTPWKRAAEQAEEWLSCPTLKLLSEQPRHWMTLADICARGRLVGPQIHDARIAALCVDHGVDQLWSADRDLSRIDGLAVCNPLVSS
jgi:toxin-antitoxin system PIN domain toxin